jgi:hypothetical protein
LSSSRFGANVRSVARFTCNEHLFNSSWPHSSVCADTADTTVNDEKAY